MSTQRLKVLYIISQGWSGSTILGNTLREVEGFFHAGELRNHWKRERRGAALCGCGLQVSECEVWSAVMKAAFPDSGPNGADPAEIVAWQKQAGRLRHRGPLLRLKPGQPSGVPAIDSYAQLVDRLYAGIAEVTGARVIVDSSKRSLEAALLNAMPGIDPFFVHLVRDPRAVGYSWRRRKARQELERRTLGKTMRFWMMNNVGAEIVRRRYGRGRSIMVRYEDFVAHPRQTLERITRLVGENPASLPLVDERTVQLGANHTVSGNPARFKTGAVELREDDEWVRYQSRSDRVKATAAALPVLRHYGYALRPKRPAPSA